MTIIINIIYFMFTRRGGSLLNDEGFSTHFPSGSIGSIEIGGLSGLPPTGKLSCLFIYYSFFLVYCFAFEDALFEHPIRRISKSDRFVNSFIMIVCENLFFVYLELGV